MRLLLPLLVLTGCQTPPPPPEVLPAAEPSQRPHALLPAVVGHYTLGAYVDPENELIRHDGHSIQRLEVPARWDLRPRWLAEPAVPAEEPKPEAVPVALAAPVPVRSAPAPVVALVPALTPGADGVLDLVTPPEVEAGNPFAVRVPPPDAGHEISVQIGGIIHGTVPCALVNGRTVQAGETVGPLELVQVEPDTVLFRHAGRLLRLPVTLQPTRVRLAL